MSNFIEKEHKELTMPITSMIEHQGDIFIASGNYMFRLTKGDDKFRQMTFVTLEPKND